MRIFVLDDMEERLEFFRRWYDHHEYVEAKNCLSAIKKLSAEKPFDILFLDHDLEPEHYKDLDRPSWKGTGREVCRFIRDELPAEKRPQVVVVHSWNPNGAFEMMNILHDAGIRGIRVKFLPGFEFLDVEALVAYVS